MGEGRLEGGYLRPRKENKLSKYSVRMFGLVWS